LDTSRKVSETVGNGERDIKREYSASIRWLKRRRTIEAISRIIAESVDTPFVSADDVASKIVDTDGIERVASVLAKAKGRVHLEAGHQVVDYLSKRLAERRSIAGDVTSGPVSYGQANELAVFRTQSNRLALIREINDDQRATIRSALETSAKDGLNPRRTARVIRGSIGLTEHQQRVVYNYRRELESGDSAALGRALRDKRSDRKVQRLFDSGEALSKAEIDSLVDKYESSFLDYRAETIARTEALRAAQQGANDNWNNAVQSGSVSIEQVVRTWLAAKDIRVRDSHRTLNGQKRKLGESFITSSGVSLRYPCDPDGPASETIQCRCVLVTRLL
jgi:hypothetical protein